jgi:very-short-patch-repair endonuclease
MTTPRTRFTATAAKRLRADSTDAERKLWARLRDRRLLGFKFVRQQPIGRYIADFACRDADLIIELDGGQHGGEQAITYDEERTRLIAERGYRVVRFWNNDVLTNADGVLQVIAGELQKAPSPSLRYAKSDPSPKGEVVAATTYGEEP